MSDYVDRIAKLEELRKGGALTQSEFDSQKKMILEKGEGGSGVSGKEKSTTLILAIFGLHYFYLGQVGKGILFLLTGGGFLIWWIADLISISSNKMRDDTGALVTK